MISAIVVTHDSGATIERCLHSVEQPGLEIVVVDNVSCDGSVELVHRRFPQIRVVQATTNLGFGAANNLGARTANGEFLLLLNPDAWVEPGALEILHARLLDDARCGLVAPLLRYPDGSPQFSWSPGRGLIGEVLQRWLNRFEHRPWAHGPGVKLAARISGRRWHTVACVLTRRAAFDEIGGFDEGYFMYFEDVDLCRRLEAAGWRLASEKRAVAVHEGGLRGAPVADDLYRPSQIRFYRCHRPSWETAVLVWRLRRRFGDAAVDRWLASERDP